MPTLRSLSELSHTIPFVHPRWQGKVTLVPADMREWQASEPADILVSELLGSFGDNELSPECLDGAMRFLKPGGISIPSSYTSFLHPVTTHKLWTDVAVRHVFCLAVVHLQGNRAALRF